MLDTATLIHIIVTVAAFASFILILIWAFGGRAAKKSFEEASNLPFADDDNDNAARSGLGRLSTPGHNGAK